MIPEASPLPNDLAPESLCENYITKVLKSLGSYLLSGITFLLIIGALVYFIHFFLLLLQVVWRKLDEALRRYAFFNRIFHTVKEKEKIKIFKKLPPPIKYNTREEKAMKCILCAICLEEFKAEELCQILPLCDHIFHSACIRPWLVDNQICPNCRSPVTNGNKKQREQSLQLPH